MDIYVVSIELGVPHGKCLSQEAGQGAGVPKVTSRPTLLLDESVHTLHGKGLHGPQGWSGAHGSRSNI